MPKILIINPNTTQAVTSRLLAAAQQLRPKEFLESDVVATTAPFGAPYISNEASFAIAGHAVLSAWEQACAALSPSKPFQSVLIGCFGDPGLWAMREVVENTASKVHSLAEASFIAAAKHGKFAIVTGGERWKPMLERLAANLGFAPHLQIIHTLKADGGQLAANPDWAVKVLRDACVEVANSGVDAVILGGAGLAGYAARFNEFGPQLDIPVIDSETAGVEALYKLPTSIR